MAAEGLRVQVACQVLGVSESGFYAWRGRPPTARAVRHAWLTDLICQIHADFRGVYGSTRGRRTDIGPRDQCRHQAVEVLMRRAGIQGISGRPRWRRAPHLATAGDLVDRQFHRDEPDQLWVTDITEHPP
jgi:putative transposase